VVGVDVVGVDVVGVDVVGVSVSAPVFDTVLTPMVVLEYAMLLLSVALLYVIFGRAALCPDIF